MRNDRDRPGNRRPGNAGSQRTPGYMKYYKARTADQVREHLDRPRSTFDGPFQGVAPFRPKPGDNVVRILPPTWDNPKHYAYAVWEHRFVGSRNGIYLCLSKMKNERCPICEEERAVRRSGNVEDANKMAAKERWLCYVLHRDSEKPDQPLVWDMWGQQMDEFDRLTRNRKNNAVIFPEHPEEGYDLSFNKTQLTRDVRTTRYGSYQFDREASPMHPDPAVIEEVMQWLDEHPIPDMLKFRDAEYLEGVMSGTMAEPDEELDDDDEEQPSRIRSGPRAEADDERDDDDEDQADDDDEDKDEDDKDEDEDEDEEDGEEEADEEEQEEEEEAETKEPELRQRRPLREPPREERRASSNSNSHKKREQEQERPRPGSSRRERERPSRYNR